jgi:hypothetical protein
MQRNILLWIVADKTNTKILFMHFTEASIYTAVISGCLCVTCLFL